MTPKEKANSLIEKFKETRVFLEISGGFPLDDAEAIHCAKICVNEIIHDIPMYLGNLNPKWYYWNEVKQELEKM